MVPIKTGFDRSALSYFHACRVLKRVLFFVFLRIRSLVFHTSTSQLTSHRPIVALICNVNLIIDSTWFSVHTQESLFMLWLHRWFSLDFNSPKRKLRSECSFLSHCLSPPSGPVYLFNRFSLSGWTYLSNKKG